MKKLSLEMLRLSTNEILERSQMKKITGGYGGGESSYKCCVGGNCSHCVPCKTDCQCPSGTRVSC